MNKKKWLITGICTAVVVLAVAMIGSIVMAADSNTPVAATATTTPPTTSTTTSADTLLDKIITIYQGKTGVTIDKAALQASIDEARQQMETDALQARLQEMVTAGKITQAEADQILSWWQAKPDVLNGAPFGGAGMLGGFGGHGMGRMCIR